METEYVSIQRTTDVENIQSSFFFLLLILSVPGIPAAIDGNYLELGIVLSMGLVLFVVYYWKAIPREYVQFVGAILICSFNNCIFLFQTVSLYTLSKGVIYLRGYAFGSLNVALLMRFTSLTQKIIFLIYAYAFRLTLMMCLDSTSADPYAILRSFYVDMYVFYIAFFHEKKNRSVFKRFYEQREELTKFKELLSDYFPQSITVFKNFMQKPLFMNKAFMSIFEQTEINSATPKINSDAHIESDPKAFTTDHLKLDLRHLQVDKNTIREVGSVPSDVRSSTDPVYLQDIIDQITGGKLIDQKPLSLSAFYSREEENKSFEVILTKIKWDGDDATAIILNDTTYQEKLISLKISDANKDQIIATVSHELRTPLNGIIGILGMAEKRVHDDKVIEYLGLCRDNAHLLLGLVNSLLDLHQVRQGKLKLNPARINIRQVLNDVTKLFTFQCNNKGIYLRLNVADTVGRYICTDENRLKQILINLIGNALKFTLEGGITVEVGEHPTDKSFLIITVSDTGIGIQEEDKSKLFQMYEKLEHGRSINKNGVGLGLTISNTLACLLSGKVGERAIELKSSVNQGSQFTFKILKELEGTSIKEDEEKIDESLELEEKIEINIPESPKRQEFTKENLSRLANLKSYPAKIEDYAFWKHESPHFSILPKNPSAEHLLSPTFTSTNLNVKAGISPHCTSPTNNLTTLASQSNRQGKGSILVVDDNTFNLLVAENMIRELGYSFKGAKSGLEAIDILKTTAHEISSFKAILMDCQMPVMDGFQTAKVLRKMMKEGELQEIPIIALTANNGEEDIQECYKSGMVGHLSKPLFPNALIKALAKSYQSNSMNLENKFM